MRSTYRYRTFFWPAILILRGTVHGLAGDVAAALIVLIAVVGAAAYVTVGPDPYATRTLDAATPAGDLTEATLEVDAGASTVTVSGSTEVGSDLYRAHLEYTGPTPTVNHDSSRGTVRINQPSNNFGILQPRHFKADVH